MLMQAAAFNSADVIRALLPFIDARKKAGTGQTALMIAAMCDPRGATGVLQALLPVSDLLAKDSGGHTALILASKQGYAGAAEALLAGSNLRDADHQGRTALDHWLAHPEPRDTEENRMIGKIRELMALEERAQIEAELTPAALADGAAEEPGERAVRRAPKAL